MLRRRLALGVCLLLAGPAVIGSVGHVFEAEGQRPTSVDRVSAGSTGRFLVASGGHYGVSCVLSLDWLREIAAGDCRIQPPQP